VWFTSYSSTEAYAYFYDPAAASLRTYPLGSTNQAVNLTYYNQEGLAVDSKGNVWIGANNQLAELVPSTGVVTQWTIPTPTASAVAGADGLSPIVTNLVIGPGGEVVMSEVGAATLVKFDPSKQAFGTLEIPQVGDVQAMVVAPDGTIAVAMSNHQSNGSFANDLVVLLHPDGIQASVTAPSSWSGVAGSEFVTGDWGHVSTIDSATAATAAVSEALSAGTGVEPNVAGVLASGVVALGTTTGIDIISDGSVQTITLPQFDCSGTVVLPPGDTQTPFTTCQETPKYIVVDSAGNIWLSPATPQNLLGLIPS
jgi:hypothetical protein